MNRRTSQVVLLLLFLVGTAPLAAQVFPHLDGEKELAESEARKREREAAERAARQAQEKELETAAAKARQEKSAMSAAERLALAKKEWDDLTKAIDTTRKEMARGMTNVVKSRDSSIQGMLRARGNMMLRSFSVAQQQLRRVKPASSTPSDVNHFKQQLLVDVRQGEALAESSRVELLKDCVDIPSLRPETVQRRQESLNANADKLADKIIEESKNSAYIESGLLARASELRDWVKKLSDSWVAFGKAEKVASENPSNGQNLMKLATQCLDARTPDVARARLICELLIKRHEDTPEAQVMNGAAFLRLADAWVAVYDYRKATEALDQGTQICSGNAAALNQITQKKQEVAKLQDWYNAVIGN